MIDWLKYFPMELRRVEKAESPKGPKFSKARTVKCNIAGSKLLFKVPRHRPSSSAYKSQYPKNRDLLDFPARSYSPDVMPNDHWQQNLNFYRSWAFYGPWFSGAQTQLSMSVTIINKTKHQEGVSFFHPRAFEDAMADYLASLYGHDTIKGEIIHTAPVNWKSINNLPVFSAVFDVMPTEIYQSSREQLFVLPVTDQHIVVVTMRHHFFFQGTIKQCKEKFDSKPMEALAEDILNSFTLELSPEIQAQWDRVKEECPDMSLIEKFPPLKWPMGAESNVTPEVSKLNSQSPGLPAS